MSDVNLPENQLDNASGGPWFEWSREAKAIGSLAVPLGAANVGMMMLGIVDSAVVGRLGELELGAVGVANMLFFAVTVVGLGVMLALDPLVSQALGANEPETARRWLWQGIWSAMLVSIPLCGALLCVRAVLTSIQFEPAAIPLVEVFMLARLPGIPVFLVFAALRSYLQAHRLTTPVVVAVACANLVNLPLVGLLVLGDRALVYVGLPAMGFPALGVGIAAVHAVEFGRKEG